MNIAFVVTFYLTRVVVVTVANATLKTSWLFYLAHINKGPNVPILYMPHTPNVSTCYQCLHLSPRLRNLPPSLIPFVPTN
jgi:hypothetical protein